MNRLLFYAALACLYGGLAACAPQAEEPPAATIAPAPTRQAGSNTDDAAVQEYETKGVVQSIMANKRFMIIDHETIPDYMDAMSMPFAVKDSTILEGIEANDRITFTLAVSGSDVFVTAIEKEE